MNTEDYGDDYDVGDDFSDSVGDWPPHAGFDAMDGLGEAEPMGRLTPQPDEP
jgi:hypothetical protein